MQMEILLPLLFIAVVFVVVVSFAQSSEPLAVGTVAPSLVLQDQQGLTVELPFSGQPVVLAFFPRDNTSRCLAQLREFTDAKTDFNRRGWDVVFIAIADTQSNAAFCNAHQIALPILADADGRAAKQYGSIVNFGFYRFAKRTTFLVNAEGNIAKHYVVAEPLGHCAEVLAAIDAFS